VDSACGGSQGRLLAAPHKGSSFAGYLVPSGRQNARIPSAAMIKFHPVKAWKGLRAGLNPVARKGVRPWPRVGRRRPWEPPQPRWGHGLQPRTTGESPISRPQKKYHNRSLRFAKSLRNGV
jgi:hypothetical protein